MNNELLKKMPWRKLIKLYVIRMLFRNFTSEERGFVIENLAYYSIRLDGKNPLI